MTAADWAVFITIAIVIAGAWWFYISSEKPTVTPTFTVDSLSVDNEYEEVVCTLETSDLSSEQLKELKDAIRSDKSDILIDPESDRLSLLTLIQQCIDVKYRGSEKEFIVGLYIIPTTNGEQVVVIHPRVHSYFSIDLTNWLACERSRTRAYLYSVDRGETIYIDGSNRNDELYGTSSAGYPVQISVPDGEAKVIKEYAGEYKTWNRDTLLFENAQFLQVDYPWDEPDDFGNRNLVIHRPRR